MKELLEKISSYNLFNYLFPGILFAVIATKYTSYSLLQEDILIGAFFYYFIGLVISRFGSLIIEPVLKKIKFLNFADYKDFVAVSKNDDKLEVLSEVNNMYRTLLTMFLLLIALKTYEHFESLYHALIDMRLYLVLALLIFLFGFSYRKQTEYITKRIDANKDSE